MTEDLREWLKKRSSKMLKKCESTRRVSLLCVWWFWMLERGDVQKRSKARRWRSLSVE